jgi:uncharacterized protein (TIGR02996 family)
MSAYPPSVEQLLAALVADPTAEDTWQVLGDCLEEEGLLAQAELTRLQIRLRQEREWAARQKPERRVRELLASGVMPCMPTLENSVGMRFVLIPPGYFWMGSPRTLSNEIDQQPRRLVRLTRPFFLGIFPVTQQQYAAVRRRNPSAFSAKGVFAARVANLDTSHWPVESVSFKDIQRFLEALGRRPEEHEARREYRLPTEAEWEYACRAGICHTAYTFGRSLRPTDARFDRENDSPMPVGSYRPNLFGLYDTHGNVWEWTADWYDAGYYSYAPSEDPPGPESGHRRVLRGGGWSTPSNLCRSALRGHNSIHARHDYNGFRVALTVTKPKGTKSGD